LNVPTPYPLGVVGAKWLKNTQNVPARSIWSKSVGSFIKNSPFAWWVLGGQIGGYFQKEPSMDLLGKVGVNCFRTHHELTMDLPGK